MIWSSQTKLWKPQKGGLVVKSSPAMALLYDLLCVWWIIHQSPVPLTWDLCNVHSWLLSLCGPGRQQQPVISCHSLLEQKLKPLYSVWPFRLLFSLCFVARVGIPSEPFSSPFFATTFCSFLSSQVKESIHYYKNLHLLNWAVKSMRGCSVTCCLWTASTSDLHCTLALIQ